MPESPRTTDCKRCEGSGKRLIPSVSNKAENRGTAFVEAPCGACAGSGARQPDEIERLRARVAELEAALGLARAWGIESLRYSALQSGDLAEWFDNGCKGPPPRAPHLPRRALEQP